MLIVAATVTNVQVDMLSSSSVRVAWDRVNIAEVSGYRLFYSQVGVLGEHSVNVAPFTTNSVIIQNLESNSLYDFTVVAVAQVNGQEIIGQRSVPVSRSIVASQSRKCTS